MKQVKKPRVQHADVKTEAPVSSKKISQVSDLSKLQTDRSFLPATTDTPVHKCDCT